MKNKHLTYSERIEIESGLKQNKSLTEIANVIDKSVGTVRYEIKKHREKKIPSSFNGYRNTCFFHVTKTCNVTNICKNSICNKPCEKCNIYFCNSKCSQYQEYLCEKLVKKPYCCNGCDKAKNCHNIKMVYSASIADKEYNNDLSVSRTGEHITLDQIDYINENATERIKNGQSLQNIKMTDSNIKVSVSSLYNYTNKGLFDFKDFDLPKKVTYKKKKESKDNEELSIEKQTKITKLKEDRNYDSFVIFSKKHPDFNIVEMDTVIGTNDSSKVLLTLLFRKTNFMIAILADNKKARTINIKLNELKKAITPQKFFTLFRIILTDNGVEFNMIEEIESIEDQESINLFFCDAGKSNQKAKIEKNHVEIRKILKKGTSFDNLKQKDINTMMSHINSYCRKKLGGLSPYGAMVKEYGNEYTDTLMKELGYKVIEPKDIILKPRLLKKQK